jgi:hypothetical protein
MGLASLAILVLAKRWAPKFPTTFVLVAGSAALGHWLGVEASGGALSDAAVVLPGHRAVSATAAHPSNQPVSSQPPAARASFKN